MTRTAAKALLPALAAVWWLTGPALAHPPDGAAGARPGPDRVSGRPAEAPRPGAPPDARALAQGAGSGAGDLVLPIAAVGGAGALAAYAYARRRRRTATRTTPHGGHGGLDGPRPLPELDARARRALVGTENALLTSEEELDAAAERCGEEAVRPFREAAARAREELTAAFRLRQQLDDAYPDGESARRRMLDEIVARCTGAVRRLDAEAEDFRRLRDPRRNALRDLAAVQRLHDEADGRMMHAEAALRVMRERYASAASAPVAGVVATARERLAFAAGALAEAHRAAGGRDTAGAADRVRAAEAAVSQAGRLVEAVDRRARELAEAAGRLPEALADTEADLAAAHALLDALGPGAVASGPLRAREAVAVTVAAEVRRERDAGPFDPLEALRRVEEADGALDRELAEAPGPDRGTLRARALLERALLGARAAVHAADDSIAVHRGAVGGEARTRAAEARRRLGRAEGLSGRPEGAKGAGTGGAGVPGGPGGPGGDPRSALVEAQRADALAREALTLAENDVRAWHARAAGGGEAQARPAGAGGAVLGGIVLLGEAGAGGPPPEATGVLGGGQPARFGGGAARGRREGEGGDGDGS
ncbi:TPM domain-containing protein [Streptomyces sp. C10-9-1]|uniref:TPM domain-containing protein n=1 Tax=Streptomyces sp. C10-9-1 TaxID=1859285 RepID=UPI0027E40B31|nr:TPM domain-containing protein [Streptomyces sp. C10-9-1]